MSDIRVREFAEDTRREDAYNLYDQLEFEEQVAQTQQEVKPAPLPAEGEQEDMGGFFNALGAVADDVGRGVLQLPRSVQRGVVGGFENVAAIGEDINRYFDAPVFQILNEDGEFDLDVMSQSEFDKRSGGEGKMLNDMIGSLKLDKPEDPTVTSGITEALSQFLIGFKGVDKAVKGVAALPTLTSKGGQILSMSLKGAVADMAVFDAQDERLSNVIESIPEAQNWITGLMAADPNDSAALAKFKQGMEGLALGFVGEAIGPGIQILKKARQAREPLSADAFKQLTDVKKEVLKNISVSDHMDIMMKQARKSEQVQNVLSGVVKATRNTKTAAKGFSEKAMKVKDDLSKRVFGATPAEFDSEKVLKSAGLVDDPVVSDLMKFASEQSPKAKLSWGQTEAKALGMSVEEAQKRFGTAGDFTAAISSVKNEAIARAAKLSDDIATKGLDNPDSVESLAQFLEISSVEKMMSGEAGRALNSLKQTKSVQQVLSNIDVISKNEIEAVIKSFGNDPERLLTFGRQLGRSRFADIKAGLHSFWINSVLSGPVTHLTNLVSNLSFVAMRPLERLGAAGVGTLTGSKKVLAREALEMYHGYYEGFRDAMRSLTRAEVVDDELKKIIARGTKFDDVGDVAAERGNMLLRKAITGREEKLSRAEFLKMGPLGMGQELLARALTAPTDFLGASDQFMKMIAARGEKRALAYRSAIDDGLRGVDFDNRIKSILSNSPLDTTDNVILNNINEAAGAFAKQTVFQEDLGKMGKAIVGLRDNVPGMEYVIPFVKTPLNILDETFLKRTPVGMASARVRQEIFGGGAKAHEAIAKMAIGTSVIGMITAAYSEGGLTGAGPKNKASRERWLETNQPWSIKVGDKWYAYNRIEPIGSLIGLGARIGEVIEYNADQKILDPEEEEELVFGVAGAFTKYVTDKSFLAGVDNILSALEGDEYAIEQFTANAAGGFVPFSGMTRTIANADNKELRDMDGILERIQSGLPGLSERLPHRRNRFGDKIIAADRTLGILLPISHTPGGVSDKKTQRINEIELEAGVIISKPSNKFKGIELTPEEQDMRLENFGTFEVRGKTVKDAIIELAEQKEYQSLPSSVRGGKGDLIKRIYRTYLKAADLKFLEQNPEISVRVEKALMDSFKVDRELNPRTGQPKEKETFVGAE